MHILHAGLECLWHQNRQEVIDHELDRYAMHPKLLVEAAVCNGSVGIQIQPDEHVAPGKVDGLITEANPRAAKET
ncbi:hypothetical protein D9M68_672760 [compost metagenome]